MPHNKGCCCTSSHLKGLHVSPVSVRGNLVQIIPMEFHLYSFEMAAESHGHPGGASSGHHESVVPGCVAVAALYGHAAVSSSCLWDPLPEQHSESRKQNPGHGCMYQWAGGVHCCGQQRGYSQLETNDFFFSFSACVHLGLCLVLNTKYHELEEIKGRERFSAAKCTVVIPPVPFANE